MNARHTIQNHKHLVYAMLACIGLLLLVSGIAIGLVIRQFTAEAAPTGITACVNNYTGAVRMSPYGATTCNAYESQVSWPGTDSDTHGVGETVDTSTLFLIDPMSIGEAETHCPAGYVATGGGFVSISGPDLVLHDSRRTDDGTGWFVKAFNPNAFQQDMRVTAVCAMP